MEKQTRPRRTPLSTGRLWRALLPMLLTLGLFAPPRVARADDDEGPRRVVIMTVPRGGTRMLAKNIAALPDTRPYPQKWFYKKVRERGFETDGILRRPKDLKWVLGGADIDLLVNFRYVRRDSIYEVQFFTADQGKKVKEFIVDAGDDGLTRDSADAVTLEVEAFLGLDGGDAPPVEDEPGDDEPGDDEPIDPEKLREMAIKQQEAERAEAPEDWLRVAAMFRLTRRELLIGGTNGAVLSYKSAFYPGYNAIAEVFPLVFTGGDATALGFYLDMSQGFDRVGVLDLNDAPAQLPLMHLRAEGGLSYRLDTPRRLKGGDDFIRARLRITGRYATYNIDPNKSLPPTSLTGLVLSGHIIYPLLIDGFSLQAGFEFLPYAKWGKSLEQFGETSFTYGMGTYIGGIYMFTDNLGVAFDYGFHLYRSNFTGEGAAQFIDANAFELLQGLTAGVTYQY